MAPYIESGPSESASVESELNAKPLPSVAPEKVSFNPFYSNIPTEVNDDYEYKKYRVRLIISFRISRS